VVEKKVLTLVDLGFTRDQAATALAAHNSTTDAAEWLFAKSGALKPQAPDPLAAGEAWRLVSGHVGVRPNDEVDRIVGRLRDELIKSKLAQVCDVLGLVLEPEIESYAVSVLQVAAAEGELDGPSSEALADIVELLCEAGADKDVSRSLLVEAMSI
jgi:hypothetical protein